MGQRILVLESDAAFAGEVQTSLQALGATVEVAGDGNQGIDRAMASRPDLILLTIELPGMNGFLVCKKLKKEDALKDVPLVILPSEAT
jgi:DNA-binding response OmpR family regulator